MSARPKFDEPAVRFQTVLTESLIKELGETADDLQINRSEVLRRGLRLMQLLVELRKGGGEMLAVVHTKGSKIEVKELIPWDLLTRSSEGKKK